MTTAHNHMHDYQVGGSLKPDNPFYVKRKADEDLYEAVKSGKFCYVLNSRQMGKSSLRVRTMKRLQEEDKFACAAIDLTEIGSVNVSSETWYACIIDTLVEQLKIDKDFDIDDFLEPYQKLSPVRWLSKLFDEILLSRIKQNIVIFIDEIDSILSLDFKVDDFFALIRAYYNKRVDNPEYNRLTFVLLGVATPSDLIQDKTRTPFNIGQEIELSGFELADTAPLAEGLAIKTNKTQELLKAILEWTGGQPFLTQKVCRLIQESEENILESNIAIWLENLLQRKIIDNWQSQDKPEHLKTIQDRIFYANEQLKLRLLVLYQQIVQQTEVIADNNSEQMQLRLTGLVVRRQGKLQVYNRIYAQVFNQGWVEQALANLRPYSEAFNAWITSGGKDNSRLLRGKALEEACLWQKGKNLSQQDYQFLNASQELETQEMQKAFVAEKEANRLLSEAQIQAQRRIRIGSAILLITLISAIFAGVSAIISTQKVQDANQQVKNANQKLQDANQKLQDAKEQEIKARQKIDESQRRLEEARKQFNLAQQQQKQAEANRQQAQKEAEIAKTQLQRTKKERTDSEQQLKITAQKLENVELISKLSVELSKKNKNSEAGQVLEQLRISVGISNNNLKQAIQLSAIAQAYQRLGKLPEASEKVTKSLKILRREIAKSNSNETALRLAQALIVDGQINEDKGNMPVAFSAYKEGLNIFLSMKKIVAYKFTVEIISGTLEGQKYHGFFIYNSSLLKGKEEERIQVLYSGFEYVNSYFASQGQYYTQFDRIPEISFKDGKLQDFLVSGGPEKCRFGFNDGFNTRQFGRKSEEFVRDGKSYFGYLDNQKLVDGAGKLTYEEISPKEVAQLIQPPKKQSCQDWVRRLGSL